MASPHGTGAWNARPEVADYDYRNCASLFGYAATVHARSGGIGQLCGAGADRVDFDWWRQLTVEHLVGEKQGGYLRSIRSALSQRLPQVAPGELAELSRRIDEANTVTACSFCNSTTSRDLAPKSMQDLIAEAAAGTAADPLSA